MLNTYHGYMRNMRVVGYTIYREIQLGYCHPVTYFNYNFTNLLSWSDKQVGKVSAF